jgi:hypothetical protein
MHKKVHLFQTKYSLEEMQKILFFKIILKLEDMHKKVHLFKNKYSFEDLQKFYFQFERVAQKNAFVPNQI